MRLDALADAGRRVLATRLLDSGSASVVLFGERGLTRLSEILADIVYEQVILVVRDEAQTRRAAALARSDAKQSAPPMAPKLT